MEILIWSGAALTGLGLLAILYCLGMAVAAKRAKLSDEAMRARLQKLVPINLGAVMASFIGLLCVITGVIFSG